MKRRRTNKRPILFFNAKTVPAVLLEDRDFLAVERLESHSWNDVIDVGDGLSFRDEDLP